VTALRFLVTMYVYTVYLHGISLCVPTHSFLIAHFPYLTLWAYHLFNANGYVFVFYHNFGLKDEMDDLRAMVRGVGGRVVFVSNALASLSTHHLSLMLAIIIPPSRLTTYVGLSLSSYHPPFAWITFSPYLYLSFPHNTIPSPSPSAFRNHSSTLPPLPTTTATTSSLMRISRTHMLMHSLSPNHGLTHSLTHTHTRTQLQPPPPL